MHKTNEQAFLTGKETHPGSENQTTKNDNAFPRITLTRQGVMYFAVNLILVLTAINYSNHNVLVVAFFLLSLFAVSLVMAVWVLRGMVLSLGEIRPVFMGQEVIIPLKITFKRPEDVIPLEIKLELDNGESFVSATKSPDADSNMAKISLSPSKRGRYKLINVQIGSKFPFGLFYLRRSFAVQQTFWVYATPLDKTTAAVVKKNKRGAERSDSVFLRQYRLGDPVRRIHKKSLAMGQNILVKDMEARAPDSQWLQWDGFSGLATEQRLQVMTRKVLDADKQGRTYGLAMPTGKINPAVGEAHKHRCLRILAEF
jgi:uncharacterized protein (DUF58 family)